MDSGSISPASSTLPPSSPRLRKTKIAALVSIIVAIVITAVLWFVYPQAFFKIVGFVAHPAPQSVNGSFILSLGSPVKAADGISYTGLVEYDSTQSTYRFAAPPTEHLLNSFDSRAFANGLPYMLNIQNNGSSTSLVAYDWKNYAVVKTIQTIATGASVFGAVWAPDAKHYAYIVSTVGSSTPGIRVGDLDSSTTHLFDIGIPVGFSSDASELLVQGAPSFKMISVSTGKTTDVTGVRFTDTQTPRFMISPSGQFLTAVSPAGLTWYRINWETSSLESLGLVPMENIEDAIYMENDTLLVRMKGSDIASTYSFMSGMFTQGQPMKLSLPEDAHILHFTKL